MTEVTIRSLTKIFGTAKAVDGISLTIPNGAFVSLLGPSGCGKTTTLKMIAGFESVDGGEILFDGQDVVHSPAEKRDIGMVFQNYALFPHMTVAQNLAFGLEMRKVSRADIKARCAKVLDMVQLNGFEERYPRQLSGGQQQRVALARALVIEPRILLLDEPLANLDAKLREEMRVFIRDLQRRVGITTVYVTHDQAEAMTMSDTVVVMFGGKIAQAGSPSEVYDRPVSRQVAGFVGQVNLLEGKVLGFDNGRARVSLPTGELFLVVPESVATGDAITLVLRPEAATLAVPGTGGWTGKVVASYYSGSLIDYRVVLDCGIELHVQTLPSTRFKDGDRIEVAAPTSAFWPLGADA